MSVKRYHPNPNFLSTRQMLEDYEGDYVLHSDYASLLSENEILRKGCEANKRLLHKWVSKDNKRHAKAKKKKR